MVVKVFAEMHVEVYLLTAYLSELTWSKKEGFSFVHFDRIEMPGFGRAIKFEGIEKDDGEVSPIYFEGDMFSERLGTFSFVGELNDDWAEATREAQNQRRRELVQAFVETVQVSEKDGELEIDVHLRDVINVANGLPTVVQRLHVIRI